MAGKKAGYDLDYSSIFLGSSDATAFTQEGIPSSSLAAMDPAPPRYYHTRHDNYDDLDTECLKSGVKIMLKFFELYDKEGLPDLPSN
jgi:Zn-dependent M28 family amino/carboxypeptidase